MFLLVYGLSACGANFGSPTTATAELPTGTPVPPSPTPPPLVATVNGEWLTEQEHQEELERFLSTQTALGAELPREEAGAIVLEDMIDQLLLAQGAREAGYECTETDLQARIDALAAQMGGEDTLSDWVSEQGYTRESFRSALVRMVEAAWMRDKIIADVPLEAEQVHARQILLYNEETAGKVAEQLASGADFAELAVLYDPDTGGELGWFPRGYLFAKELEETAFRLEPGQHSEVVASDLGYHILQVIDRLPDRPLSPDALLVLQEAGLRAWLEESRAQAEIDRNP